MYVAQRETFQKAKPYRLEHTKIEFINQDKWNGRNFPLKDLVVIFGNSIPDKSNWDKISTGKIKQPISGTK